MFHLIMLLVSLLRNRFSDSLNRNFWLLKLSVLVFITYTSFKTSKLFVKTYFWISVLFSPFTIMWMMICLMDLLFKLAENLGEKYFDRGNRVVGGLLVGFSVLGAVGSVAFFRTGVLYACGMTLESWVFLGLSLVTLGLTLLKFNPKANLLTSLLYICATSVLFMLTEASREDENCSPATLMSKKFQIFAYIGLSLAGTLFISLISESNEDYEELPTGTRTWETAPTADNSLPDARQETTTQLEESLWAFRKQTIIFHVYMVFLSSLATVLITSWKFDEQGGFSGLLSPKSQIGHAVQQVALFFSCGLLTWVLVAPRIFPDREF